MDQRLKKALEFSNFQQTFSTKLKTLREKIEGKLTFGHNGGLFKIDRPLLTFVQSLCQLGRSNNVVLLDANNNPILVEDLEKFKDEIYDRYFTAMNEYYNEHQSLKKARSIEKVLDV